MASYNNYTIQLIFFDFVVLLVSKTVHANDKTNHFVISLPLDTNTLHFYLDSLCSSEFFIYRMRTSDISFLFRTLKLFVFFTKP